MRVLLKRIALSYWTVILAGLIILGLHAWWWSVSSAQRGEIFSGYGATLIVLGLWVAARPYIRSGVQGIAEAQVQKPQYTPLLDTEGRIIAEANAKYQEQVSAAKPDILAERVIAVAVVMVGTLMNGYGPPLAGLVGN